MFTLFHHPFCPHSRFIRLALGEHGLDVRLVEERVWERREAFLALNPAGTTPVLIAEGRPAVPGAGIIAEYLDETHGAAMAERRLLPSGTNERIEVRRLMAWFNDKFFEEASNPLVTERIYKRFMSEDDGGGAPAADVIRAAKANVRYHLAYIGWLARTRNFLAGDRLELCGPRRRGASFGDRLSGRRAMDRGRRGKGLVRAGEIPPVVPSAAERMAGGRAGVADLCGSRLLNTTAHSASADIKDTLAHQARMLGFDCVGVTGPDAIADAGRHFREFLDAGAHGDMDWLAANPERRTDPRVLWPGVRSVIMLGVNYGPDENPLAILAQRTRGAISVYARGDDYHDLIKKRLKALARWLVAASGCEVKVFVDTAAVMEKPLAQAAGLGWQGKHTNLVSRQLGSWLFLGAIFTDSDLPRDAAEADHCGSCRACLDICPTSAFPAPYKLDARRCISYLTIESRAPIPHRVSQGHRQPHLWLRRLPRGLPVEQIRAGRPRGKARGARRLARARACRSRKARRRRVPRTVYEIAGQAHRPRPLHPQCADRDRQLQRPRVGGRGRTPAGRCEPFGARRRGVGVVAIDGAGGVCGTGGRGRSLRTRRDRARGMAARINLPESFRGGAKASNRND